MLFGRRRELELIGRRLRAGGSIAVVGDAGIGKTSVLTAAIDVVTGPVYTGGALAGLAYLPYLAVEHALKERITDYESQAVRRFVEQRVARDALLVLDDLQWAAPATLELLPLLKRQIAVAIRAGDPRSADALAATRACGIEPIELQPLANADSRRFLALHRPALSAKDEQAIMRGASGNPLLLHELSATGDASPTLFLSLRARLAHASREAGDAMALLALLGRPADRALLPAAAIEELRGLGLVLLDDEDGVTLRHALLGESAVDAITDERRRELHERIAVSVCDAGEAARHYQAAGRPEEAMKLALQAAEAAASPDERAAHLELAADAAGSGSDSVDLRLRAADALLIIGAFTRAESVAAKVETDNSLARAESLLIRGRAQWALGRSGEAQHAFGDGLGLARGSHTAVEVRLRLALCQPLLNSGQYGRARAAARSALRLAEQIDAHTAQAHWELAAALGWSGLDGVVEHTDRAAAQARRDGDTAMEVNALHLAAGWHQNQLDARQGLRLLRKAVRLASTAKLPSWELQMEWALAHFTYHALGRYDEVIPMLRAAAADPEFGQTDPDQIFADLAVALADTGNAAEARRILDDNAARGRYDYGRGILLQARADLEWLVQRPDRTVETARIFDATINEPNLRPPMYALRDYASWDLGLPAGPSPPRNRLPLIDLWRQESLAIRALGRPREAERRFLEAAVGWHGNGLRYEIRCLWAAGEAARLAGNEERARRHLLRAERLAARHGLQPLLGRIRRTLRLVGTHRSTRSAAEGKRLTRRELAVLTLVREGLNSREIGARLAISPNTADSIVKTSMAKLGARTRLSAAIRAGSVT